MRQEECDVVTLHDVVVNIPGRVLLNGLDLTVRSGESIAVMGPSGSGKTTLLNCIAGLVQPTEGSITVGGSAIHPARENAAAAVRLNSIGITFQNGDLLPELTVLENVALPALFARRPDAYTAAQDLLSAVGLGDFGDRPITSLSGGERQRVAVARALVCRPALVLADEPTGSLDQLTAVGVAELLIETCRAHGAGLIMATHDPAVAAAASRTLRLTNGVLVNDASFDAPAPACS